MWRQRCDLLHECDEQGLLRTESQNLTTAINAAFDKGTDSVPLNEHSLFTRHTRAQLHKKTPTQKRDWLLAVHSAQDYKKQLDCPTESMRLGLRQWLES